jgi:hypothetical protein
VGAQFGAAFFDVADEVLIEVVGEFQAADQPLGLGVGVGDGAAQGRGLTRLLAPGGLGEGFLAAVQQRVAVGAKDLVDQEPGQPVEEVVFADAEDDRVAVGPPCLLRRAGVSGGLAFAVAEHAPPAQVAEQVAAQRVDAPGLRVGAEPGRGAGSFAADCDVLRLDEGLQVYQRLVDGLG